MSWPWQTMRVKASKLNGNERINIMAHQPKFRCVLHGSFRKHWSEIQKIHRLFTANGIEVLAPTMSEIKTTENGFVVLESDGQRDQRLIELLYLHNLKQLGDD